MTFNIEALTRGVEADMARQRAKLGTTFYIGEDSMGGLRNPDVDIDQILKPKTIQKVLPPPADIRFYRRRAMNRVTRSGK